MSEDRTLHFLTYIPFSGRRGIKHIRPENEGGYFIPKNNFFMNS
jgi:hypothetical protein